MPSTRRAVSGPAGRCHSLLVVHGLGRFVYTPLLPWLVEDGLLTVQEGASIASWNYLGYLTGALLAVRWHRVAQIRRSLPWALALHVLSSLLQTQAESADALAALRLANGISNGLVFVQAPSLISSGWHDSNACRPAGWSTLGFASA